MTDFTNPIGVLEQRLRAMRRTPPSRKPKIHDEMCQDMVDAIEVLKRETEVE
ncbi:hypothetical protein [Methanococcoides sp. FTZ1]|uniref:hypothetical protein n=1 Tax=Methanococcoides sp. FTZ1 TaxID=3439061 RepID=UPI003F845CC7